MNIENHLKVHVDEFVADCHSDAYAAWVLMHFRLPAVMQSRFRGFMNKHKLFCAYNFMRYRVIGASRMGDIWLVSDFNKERDYDLRVDINDCTNFGPTA